MKFFQSWDVVTLRKINNIVAAIMICAYGALSPAIAQSQTPQQPSIQSLIKSNSKAELTIHKHDSDAGNAQSPAKGLAGVKYKIQKIEDLDIKKLSDWNKYEKRNATSPGKLGSALTVVTGNDGIARTTLPLGFYVVTEVNSPQGIISDPIMVSLPETMPNNSWNYNVHVQPKSKNIGIKVTVSDDYVVTGGSLSYTMTGDVPQPPPGGFTKYIMVNSPPAGVVLDPDSVQITIGKQEVTNEDFSVTPLDINKNFHIALTPSGLAKLTTEQKEVPSTKVEMVVKGEVKSVSFDDADSGVEKSVARLYVDGSPGQPHIVGDGDIQDSVDTQFGFITAKVISQDNKEPLAGANFELYRCAQNTDDTVSGTLGQKITVDGTSNWVTNDQGMISIEGIQRDDYRGGKQVSDTFDYCLMETSASPGYVAIPHPIHFDLSTTSPVTINMENATDHGGLILSRSTKIGFIVLLSLGLSTSIVSILMKRKK